MPDRLAVMLVTPGPSVTTIATVDTEVGEPMATVVIVATLGLLLFQVTKLEMS